MRRPSNDMMIIMASIGRVVNLRHPLPHRGLLGRRHGERDARASARGRGQGQAGETGWGLARPMGGSVQVAGFTLERVLDFPGLVC